MRTFNSYVCILDFTGIPESVKACAANHHDSERLTNARQEYPV
jgi:hypothetical protein